METASHPKRKLSPEVEQEIHAAICDHTPDALDLPFDFWTRDAVNQLIHQRTGLKMPSRTLSTYLERWGFTPEKPLQTAYREEPGPVRSWMRMEYPSIAMQAKVEGAELLWLGTSTLRPMIQAPKRRERSLRLLTAHHLLRPHVLTFLVTNRRHMSWLVHDPRLTPDMILLLLDRVQERSGRPLLVIARDLPALREILGEAWSASRKARLQVRWMRYV